MITGFLASNIKACNTKGIDIKPITILMGENSSGKTSFLQALSLLTVNKILGNDIKKIKYNNPFHKLGTTSKFKNKENIVILGFEFKDKNDLKYNITCFYNNELSDDYGYLNQVILNYEKFKERIFFNYEKGKYIITLDKIIDGKENLFTEKIIKDGNINRIFFKTDFKTLKLYHYPQELEEEIIKNYKNFNKLEENLKDIFSILDEHINSIKHISKIQEIITYYNYNSDYIGYNAEKYKDIAKYLKDTIFLKKAIKNIFNYDLDNIDIFGNFYLNQKIKVDIMKKYYNKFFYLKDYMLFNSTNELSVLSENDKLFLLKDNKRIELIKIDDELYKYYETQSLGLDMFGSSINNLIPILTQFAKNREHPEKYNITIVEEPELGLHPQAQAKLVETLFGEDDYYKTQTTILETHSSHIVNKLRYLIYQGKIKPEEVVIYYKKQDNDEFIQINIDKFGQFDRDFPKDFYDATLANLLEMKRAKRKNASS